MDDTRFGSWTVLACEPPRTDPKPRWLCRCDCGAEAWVLRQALRCGDSTRCPRCGHASRRGKPPSTVVHGESHKTTENNIWREMHARCSNENHRAFADYGGRGIGVAPAWHGAAGYVAFLAHVGRRPSKSHSIDRIDNARGYEPGNVRWATAKEQAANRRPRRDRCAA